MTGRTAVGIDMGGTFTDIITHDSIGLTALKIPKSNDPAVEKDTANNLLTAQKVKLDYGPRVGLS